MWERACSRRRFNGRHLNKHTTHRLESKTPARGWRFAYSSCDQRGTTGLRAGLPPLLLAASARSLAACLLRAMAAALACSRLCYGLLASQPRGGRPVCWVRILVVVSLATLWLPAGVESKRRRRQSNGARAAHMCGERARLDGGPTQSAGLVLCAHGFTHVTDFP